MKKLFLLSVTVLSFAFSSKAQEISENAKTSQNAKISQNAIGFRLGDSDGFGAEISYQHALGDKNRLEFDLGWRDGNNYNGFKLAGLYQWIWNLDGRFNWYVGAGGGLGSFSYDTPGEDDISDEFIFLAGDIGIEYNFAIPLLLSLDFRPEIDFGDNLGNNDLDFDIAFGVRYQF